MSAWLICGGRYYRDTTREWAVLDALVEEFGRPAIIIEGGADGADAIAKQWADVRGIAVATVEAKWNQHGKRAGYIRNAAMLYLQPSLVVCFPGGKGTEMMYQLAKEAKVKTLRFS